MWKCIKIMEMFNVYHNQNILIFSMFCLFVCFAECSSTSTSEESTSEESWSSESEEECEEEEGKGGEIQCSSFNITLGNDWLAPEGSVWVSFS